MRYMLIVTPPSIALLLVGFISRFKLSGLLINL